MKNFVATLVIAISTMCGFFFGPYVAQAIDTEPGKINSELRGNGVAEKTCESEVKPAGYGTRNIKYGNIHHSPRNSKKETEQFTRKMNTENIIDYTPLEYDTVEVFIKE